MKFLLFLWISLPCFSVEMLSSSSMLRVQKETEEWAIESLKKEFSSIEGKRSNPLPNDIRKCFSGSILDLDQPSMQVFISFSVPDSIWIQLSSDLAKIGGIFVLKGVPENHFSNLAKKLLKLKQQGLSASVQINPDLFDRYGVEKVPAYLIEEGSTFDIVYGAVSLEYALEKMVERGKTNNAKRLLEKQKRGEGDGI